MVLDRDYSNTDYRIQDIVHAEQKNPKPERTCIFACAYYAMSCIHIIDSRELGTLIILPSSLLCYFVLFHFDFSSADRFTRGLVSTGGTHIILIHEL